MKKNKLKPRHYFSCMSKSTNNTYNCNTYCGIRRHRVYGCWSILDVTCKNCLKTKKVRKQLIDRLLK